jgi:hypothetical protein
MNISEIIKSLEMGICPKELDYSEANCHHEIDYEKLAYNVRYNSFEYFSGKLPEELKKMPAYNEVINLMVEKNINNSPLQEIEERIKESENNTDELYGEVQK